MGRFDPENSERYGPREGVRFRSSVYVGFDGVAVVDGDGGVGARFEVRSVSGDKSSVVPASGSWWLATTRSFRTFP